MKKYSPKLMALLLASAVIASSVSTTTIAAMAAEGEKTVVQTQDTELTDAVALTVSKEEPSKMYTAGQEHTQIFTFTPEESGVYVLNTVGNGAVSVAVTEINSEEEEDEITANEELNDWNTSYADSQKQVFTDLQEGTTYQLRVTSEETDEDENLTDIKFKLWISQVEIKTEPGEDLSWSVEPISEGNGEMESSDAGEDPDEAEGDFDKDTKLRLLVSGSGDMTDFGYQFDKKTKTEVFYTIPWTDDAIEEQYQGEITEICVGEGVSGIGNGAFAQFYNLEEICLPSTLKRIGGDSALTGDLRAITFAGTQDQWETIAIDRASSYYNDPIISFADGTSHHFYEGSCGKNLTWKVERNPQTDEDSAVTATLVIRGNGEMCDYDKKNPAPWISAYCNEVVTAVDIQKGVKNIGAYAFAGMETSELESDEGNEFVIPEGVTSIGDNAFRGVSFGSGLRLVLPSTLKSIGKQIFFNGSVENIVFNGTKATFANVALGASNSELRGAENIIPCSDGDYEIPMERTLELQRKTAISGQDTEFTYLFKADKSAVYKLKGIYYGADTDVDIFFYNQDEDSEEESVDFGRAKGSEKTFVKNVFLTAGQTYVLEVSYGEDDQDFELDQDDDIYTDIVISREKTDIKYFENMVKISSNSFTYDGKEKKPSVSIKGLNAGTDYTVSYEKNKNAGTARAIIKGKGIYSGQIAKSFTIKKATPKLTIRADKNKITAGGSAKLSVSGAKGKISYQTSNKNVATVSGGIIKGIKSGTAKITITSEATTNYNKVSKSIAVQVNPKATDLTGVTSSKAGQMKLTWKKNLTGDGYVIQYAATSNFKGAKIIHVKDNSTTTQIITGLKKGSKYYARICTTDKSKKLMSKWSASKNVKIKK